MGIVGLDGAKCSLFLKGVREKGKKRCRSAASWEILEKGDIETGTWGRKSRVGCFREYVGVRESRE